MPRMKCSPSARSKYQLIAVVLLFVLWARPAQAFFGGFGGGPVIDSSNLAENVRQLVSLMQQMQQLATHLRNQERMLQSLEDNVAASQQGTINRLTGTMQSAELQSQSPSSIRGQLQNQYPLSSVPLAPRNIKTLNDHWLQKERVDLAQWQQLTRQVRQDMRVTAANVSAVVEASNGKHAPEDGKPGLTAVLQARNQLLAIAAAETNKLTALRIMRTKIRAQDHARDQAEHQLAHKQGEQVRRDWKQTTVKPIRQPF